MRPGRSAAPLVALALCLAALPAAAQHDDDETDDHAERDRLYLERMNRPETAPPVAGPSSDEEARYVRYLDELIRDRNYQIADGAGYRVQVDDPGVDPAAVAALLDRLEAFFIETWAQQVPLEKREGLVGAYLFWSYHKYNKLLGADFSRSELRPKGHYGSAFDVIALHTDSDTPGDLADTVVHEGTHQLVGRIAWTGPSPTWLNEGLACYYGYMLLGRDGFVPERVGGKQAPIFRDGKIPAPAQAAGRLETFRTTVKRGDTGDSIYGPLLAADAGAFYGGDVQFHYAASWLLVHFLMHGDDGAHAEPFARWVAAAAETGAGPTELLAAVGLDEAGLDAAVVAHAKKVKAR